MPLGRSTLNKLKSSLILLIFIVTACNEVKEPLPILGQKLLNDKGEEIDHTISKFRFLNQNNQMVTRSDYEGKVYIADFFFTTCKGICPQMTKQLARAQNELKGVNYRILSHTVNPEHDSTDVLLAYANKMDADLSNWDFVTGNAQTIYRMAASYKIAAVKDTTQPIPFVHSEYLVLIDKKMRIRGLYDGTDSLEVNKLIEDTKWLVKQ